MLKYIGLSCCRNDHVYPERTVFQQGSSSAPLNNKQRIPVSKLPRIDIFKRQSICIQPCHDDDSMTHKKHATALSKAKGMEEMTWHLDVVRSCSCFSRDPPQQKTSLCAVNPSSGSCLDTRSNHKLPCAMRQRSNCCQIVGMLGI